MKNNNYICHAPYLRNSIAYDHEFWYTCVKWWYLVLFFDFFDIFIFLAVRGVKGQKIAQKNNNYIHHAPSVRNSVAYDHDLWYISVKWWYIQVLFSISLYFHFSGCWWVKKVKNSSKWKIITSGTHHISGTA